MIIIDIWGGENSQEHLAKMFRPLDEALKIATFELGAGFLVNMRHDLTWGKFEEFDSRSEQH